MTDEQINELGNEYANKVEYPNYVQTYDGELLHKNEDVADLVAKAHADGIRKGMKLVLNTLDYAKDTISEALTKVVVDLMNNADK